MESACDKPRPKLQMTCEYFGKCASCALHDKSYAEQLELKSTQIRADFAEFYDGEIEIFSSKDERFRNRAEFGIYHHDDTSFSYTMRGFDKERVFIDSCQIVDEFIATSMNMLREDIQKSQILKYKLFGIEFLSNGDAGVLAVLIYHKKLDFSWIDAANELMSASGVKIIGRSKGQRILLDSDFITTSFDINAKSFKMRQVEGAFSQPNAHVNTKMLGWSSAQLEGVGGDLLELYCGSGNFTIVNSNHFDKVLATEISSTLINIAKINAEQNGVQNISFARLSAADTAQALSGVRAFNRLREIDLDDYKFSTIFVDPPRAGLDDESRDLAMKFDNIMYISCSPETLHRDLQILSKSHKIQAFALFDQFAYTHHLECGVFLKRL